MKGWYPAEQRLLLAFDAVVSSNHGIQIQNAGQLNLIKHLNPCRDGQKRSLLVEGHTVRPVR